MTARHDKKPLDTEINLVPFIDLMAVTIAFLLITAVWTQAGVQPVSAPGTGERPDEVAENLTLVLTDRGVSLRGSAPMAIADLDRALRALDARSATIEVDDSVRYEDLVRVIDACRGARIEGVAVTPTSG